MCGGAETRMTGLVEYEEETVVTLTPNPWTPFLAQHPRAHEHPSTSSCPPFPPHCLRLHQRLHIRCQLGCRQTLRGSTDRFLFAHLEKEHDPALRFCCFASTPYLEKRVERERERSQRGILATRRLRKHLCVKICTSTEHHIVREADHAYRWDLTLAQQPIGDHHPTPRTR